VSNIIILLLLT